MTHNPLGFDAGDANLYRYVRNDPTNQVDTFGLLRDSSAWKRIVGGAERGELRLLTGHDDNLQFLPFYQPKFLRKSSKPPLRASSAVPYTVLLSSLLPL